MHKIFTVLILFFISFTIYSQSDESNYKISCPSDIAANSSFDISLVTSNRFAKADTLELYILPDEKLSLNDVQLNTLSEKSTISFKSSLLEGYSGTAYKCIIDLSDSTFLPGTFFQFLLKFKNSSAGECFVKFVGIFKSQGKILGYINPKIKKGRIKESDYLSIPIRTYDVQRIAGSAINFADNSYMDFSLSDAKSENLLMEFWLKIDDNSEQVLKIENKILPQFRYSLSTNSFQVLSVDSRSGSQLFSGPSFLALKCWYHISVLFSIKDNAVLFYCDGKLMAKYKLNSIIEAKDLKFEFGNIDEKKSFQIDLLRVIDLNNSIEYSFNNSNFQNFASDSSTILAQFKFDKIDALEALKNTMDFDYSDVQLVKSDAPLFAKAPELNINMLSSSYELEWGGGDYKQANFYVLEKSTKNSDYIPIFKTQADNLNKKEYSYLDKKEESSEIVYYRVKQVDKDGSIVYSSQVKIGQGLVEPFVVQQNYPNPFNPKTSIVVELLQDTQVKVIVYNLEGKEITRLYDGSLEKGIHKFSFDATDLPSGVYLYKVQTPEFSQTKKMVLTK